MLFDIGTRGSLVLPNLGIVNNHNVARWPSKDPVVLNLKLTVASFGFISHDRICSHVMAIRIPWTTKGCKHPQAESYGSLKLPPSARVAGPGQRVPSLFIVLLTLVLLLHR